MSIASQSGALGQAILEYARDLGIELNFNLYFQSKDGSLNDDPNKMGGFYTMLQYRDSVDDVKAFFLARGGDWPIIRDDEGTINVDFGVAQVPETFVVSPDGVVVLRWAGPIDAVTLAQLVQQQRDLFEAR